MASKSPELTYMPTTAVVVVGALYGGVTQGDPATIFFISVALGLSVWLIGGTAFDGTRTQLISVCAIVAGGWLGWLGLGWLIYDGAGVAIGMAVAVAVLLGWQVARLVIRLIRWARDGELA